MLFDHLVSADALVTDISHMLSALDRAIGLGPGSAERVGPVSMEKLGGGSEDLGHPQGQIITVPDCEFEGFLLPIQPDSGVAPTAIQFLARRPLPLDERARSIAVGDYVTAYGQHQAGYRPTLSHCTPLATTDDLAALHEELTERGIQHRLTEEVNFVWMGLSADPIVYDAEVDGGLMLEFVPGPFAPLGEANLAPDLPEGDFLRITARSHLVEDIDHVLACLHKSLNWPDEGLVEVEDLVGYRRAWIKPGHAASAVLELLQPTSDHGVIGQAFADWGPGPYAFRLGVNGLDARLEVLNERGTPFTWLDPVQGRRRVMIDRTALAGLMVELEDLG